MTTPHGLDPAGPDLTVTEVAELLHVDRRTVIRYINDGAFPGSYRMPAKVKGAHRIPRAAVLRLIQGRRP
jgi:excisionase family DNA binding protein